METFKPIISVPELPSLRQHYRRGKKRIVSTNGCFDLIHAAHVRTLCSAKRLGDVLVVGINDDESVRLLKGPGRPLVPQNDRAEMLASLRCVDHVVIFPGLLPNDWLSLLQPDVHCKSADYSAESLPEAPVVKKYGGRIEILPLEKSFSTSELLSRVSTAVAVEKSKSAAGAVPAGQADDARVIQAMLHVANEHRQAAYRHAGKITKAAQAIAKVVRNGGKLHVLWDGRPACLAEMVVAELQAKSVAGNRGAVMAFSDRSADLSSKDALLAIYGDSESAAVAVALKAADVNGMASILVTGSDVRLESAKDVTVIKVDASDQIIQPMIQLAIVHVLCETVGRMGGREET